MHNTVYSYEAARDYCKQLGLEFDERFTEQLDATFAELHLTQVEVDVLLRQHIWHIRNLFDPANYTRTARAWIVAHFVATPTVRIIRRWYSDGMQWVREVFDKV